MEMPKLPKLTINIPRVPPETISNIPDGPNARACASSVKAADNPLAATIAKAKAKAAAEKFDEEEPNYLEIDVPFTNILKNLK